MQVLVRLSIGVVAAGALFATSRLSSGWVAAAAALLTYFVVLAALGLVAAGMVDHREDRTMRGGETRQFTGDCHECGRAMLQTGAVWICAICDRAPVHHFVGRRRSSQ